jgi:hypothetical protein
VNYVKVVLLVLQAVTSLIRFLEEKRLISEGERQEVARELARAMEIVARAKKIRDHVGKMTDAEIDAALRGDFRD